MTEHTPGPWVKSHDNFAFQIRGVFPKSKNSFVSIYHWKDSDYGCSKDEAEANARLIAAAPELLEALQWYVENDETNGYAGNQYYLNGKSKAQKAIAKATQGELK